MPALTAKAKGTARAGPNRAKTRIAAKTAIIAAPADAITTRGRSSASKLDKESASRVALLPTCCAIISPAARSAANAARRSDGSASALTAPQHTSERLRYVIRVMARGLGSDAIVIATKNDGK